MSNRDQLLNSIALVEKKLDTLKTAAKAGGERMIELACNDIENLTDDAVLAGRIYARQIRQEQARIERETIRRDAQRSHAHDAR